MVLEDLLIRVDVSEIYALWEIFPAKESFALAAIAGVKQVIKKDPAKAAFARGIIIFCVAVCVLFIFGVVIISISFLLRIQRFRRKTIAGNRIHVEDESGCQLRFCDVLR